MTYRQLVEALNIFVKYDPKCLDRYIEFGSIYLYSGFFINPNLLTEVEIEKVESTGFYWDEILGEWLY